MPPKDHKAPTQVTIAATEEPSALHEFVSRYWMLATVIGVVAVAAILSTQYLRQEAARKNAASWETFRRDVTLGAGLFGGVTTPSASVLESLSSELQGTPAGPWARALEVHQHVEDGNYNEAAGALRVLQEEYPEHPLVVEVFRFAEDESPMTLADHLFRRMDSVGQWEKKHESLFTNPALPLDCPKVRINTSKGSILVGLYQDLAPGHVENFLKHCEEGFYDGTLFHRIGRTFMIQGGDPNTREGDKATWGQGGPGYTLAPEITELRHFPYVLAAAKKSVDVESSGSQFYITTGSPHHLDGQHTVFGAVLDGKVVVDEIAAGEIEEGTTDRPRDPVVVNTTERVE